MNGTVLIETHRNEFFETNSPEGNSFVLLQHTIAPWNGESFVREQWYIHFTQAAHLARGVDPGEVGKVRVGGARYDLAFDLPEFLSSFAEGDDLRGTNECAGKKQKVLCYK